jgi:Glycosyl hydrolases family 2, sugar binding domain/Glycosyl hydrolases family 2, TIM barrel domain
MKASILPVLATSLLMCLRMSAAQTDRISLAGTWRFQLDRGNAGIEERWFERSLPDKIKLPGSLPAQGIGDDVSVETKWTGDIIDQSWFTAPEYAAYRMPGNIKVPFWLQPEKYYAGAAWYQRDIEIPADWEGKRVVLTLERPHWETRVWVDGKAIGSNNSLSTPHEYDLGTALAPGKHRLTIRVDNGLIVDVGVNSHCITDHTQGNWNGMVGRIELRATPMVWFEDVQVYPASANTELRVVVRIGNATARSGGGELEVVYNHQCVGRKLAAGLPQRLLELPVQWSASAATTVEFKCPWPEDKPTLWDEFNPALHPLVFLLSTGEAKSVNIGLREISTQGTQFLINGRKTFFRGTLECCIFPLTGHPPTDVESWKRIIRIAKAHGLNLFRFHSYCPPEAAFVAADELGFYYQVETCWANQSTTIGDGKPVDQWVYDETDRILKAYGNHPSFLLMPHGNEPGGKNAGAYLAKWVNHFKAQDPRRLWTSGSGWPLIAENQFHVTPDPRIQHWGAGLKSRINARPPETRTDYRDFIQGQKVPVISHEIGEWCVYPNFDEMPKYTGYLKPRNFEIFRDTLRAHGMGDLAHQFLLASGKLQTLCYKEDIESALRTPGMGGFELLDLHDFPGQGTALVGVLDPFWEGKGYVTAEEYSRFCNSTVPLARLSKRVFTSDERLEAEIEVAHFGPVPLKATPTTWKLVGDNGKVVANGKLPLSDIPIGSGIVLGSASIDLRKVPPPARYKFVVTVGRPSRRPSSPASAFQNDWDVWIYPAKVDTQPSSGVVVTDELNDQALATLNAGGKVLLLIPPSRVKGDKLGKVALGFSSIFWNTAWTHRQPPTTLGILCNPKHPALAEFPTDFHSNWQWWYLISEAGAMIMDDLPKELRPTVQVIDDWVTGRKLGLVFEARMGAGKLLVCSIDLTKGQEHNPVARQMLHSLLNYMSGPKFKPTVPLTRAEVRKLF